MENDLPQHQSSLITLNVIFFVLNYTRLLLSSSRNDTNMCGKHVEQIIIHWQLGVYCTQPGNELQWKIKYLFPWKWLIFSSDSESQLQHAFFSPNRTHKQPGQLQTKSQPSQQELVSNFPSFSSRWFWFLPFVLGSEQRLPTGNVQESGTPPPTEM